MQVQQAVADTFVANGCDVVFGLMGAGNLGFIDRLTATGVRYYGARHETGAIGMADSWARVTGRTAVVTVAQGPGLTNAVTALVEAWKSRTAIVLVIGERPDVDHPQHLDHARLLESVDILVVRITSADDAVERVNDALRLATQESRPVALLCPVDLFRAEFSGSLPRAERITSTAPVADALSVAAAADLISAANRPLILAGRGAVTSGAGTALRQLGHRIGALLSTTAMANGYFADSPFGVGVCGGFASALAAQLFEEVDVVVVFGAGLNEWTLGHGRLFGPGVRFIQCDSVESQLGRTRSVDIRLHGDARATAAALELELSRRGVASAGFRTAQIEQRIASRDPRSEYVEHSLPSRIDPRSLVLGLAERVTCDRSVTVDSGHSFGFPCMYFPGTGERSFVFSQAFMSLGIGIAGGIGASIGRPDRLSVVFAGDGGTLMSLGELETAVRYSIPLLLVVMNDAAYGAEVHQLADLGLSTNLARFDDFDFAGVARGMGAQGVTVRSESDLDLLAAWLENPTGPMVLDGKVNPAVRASWMGGPPLLPVRT